ncbi:MAG: hypothetical protein ROM54_07620, partial [Anaerobiospirillum sp.]|nr:hypothetical protein [Anaerobiospirillum sp.]
MATKDVLSLITSTVLLTPASSANRRTSGWLATFFFLGSQLSLELVNFLSKGKSLAFDPFSLLNVTQCEALRIGTLNISP